MTKPEMSFSQTMADYIRTIFTRQITIRVEKQRSRSSVWLGSSVQGAVHPLV